MNVSCRGHNFRHAADCCGFAANDVVLETCAGLRPDPCTLQSPLA